MPAYDGRYDRELRVFVDTMKAKMAMNYHKGRWEGVNLKTAIKELRNEVNELEEAVKGGNTAEIMLESADLAVWSLIISTIAIETALKGKGPSRAGRHSRKR